MITKVRNKLSQPIVEFGLNSDETKVIFYNRAFWSKELAIRYALISDKIELLDDYGNVVVSVNSKYPQGFSETFEFSKMCTLFNFEWPSLTDDDKEDLLEDIGQYVLQFIKSMFRKANVQGYTRQNLLTALGNIPTMLKMGDIGGASTAVAAIPLDSFFTVQRRARIRNLLDAVDLT